MGIFDRILDRLTGKDTRRLEIRIAQMTKVLKSWKAEYSKLKPELDKAQLEAQELREINRKLQNEVTQREIVIGEYRTKLTDMQEAVKTLYFQIDLLKEAASAKEVEKELKLPENMKGMGTKALTAKEAETIIFPQQIEETDPIIKTEQILKDPGEPLSENELKIIKYLQENPESRQIDILADLKMNKTTLSNILKKLVAKSIMLKNESRGTYQFREMSSVPI